MIHLVTETSDGLVHVDNYVMGRHGQHHVHTKEGYLKWKNQKGAQTKDEDITYSKGTCTCGLDAGDVKEHDGEVWHDDTKFLE